VLDGTRTHTEWKAYIPQEQNAFVKNPTRGFISSANQFPVDATYPYYVHSNQYEAFRNRRINHVLSKSTSITPADMMKLQNDNFNLQAAESLPLMLSLINISSLKGEEARIAELLGYWDFVNSKESVAASYYEAWWNAFMELLWDEFYTAKVSLDIPDEYSVIRMMKNNPNLPFYDRVSTPDKEDLQQLVKLAFSQGVKRVNEWETANGKSAQWADYKDTYIQHLLRIDALSTHVRVGGNKGIVNASGHRAGPSWRFIVSLEKQQVKAWGIYPAGQSGNPGSRFYDNFVENWAEGKYYPLVFSSSMENVKKKAFFTTQLIPD
jgi:penicillin amidase